MNTARPNLYDDAQADSTVRTRAPIPKNKLNDNGVKAQARNLGAPSAPLNFDFNEDDDSQLITWLQENTRKDPNFNWRGYKIIKIDTANNKITLRKNGVDNVKLLSTFIKQAQLDIKFKKGSIKLDGKVVQRDDVINLIKQDIQNERPFKGKKILSIDVATNTVTIESDSVFGITNKISIDQFILDYVNTREFGYLDSDSTVQNLAEQTRLQNIADMAQAFKDALGIKPPKVVGYAPVKDSRLVESVCSGMMTRDPTGVWTVEELQSVYKSGNVPYSNKKVSGELINQFIPTQPELKTIKISPPSLFSS